LLSEFSVGSVFTFLLLFFFLEKRIQTSLPRLALASASRKSESYYNPSFEQMVSEPKVFAQNPVIVPVVSENHLQDSKKSREAN
jgi:predicted membrane-bound dolichyl-phosphate-mannose-protein mannosyltransferase